MHDIKEQYFNWMCQLVKPRFGSYRNLFHKLDETEFYYILPMDGNRAEDGIDLRYKFGEAFGIDERIIAQELDVRPCSVLEMMVALANRCETQIMWNPDMGNRTSNWFWMMIRNLGLDKQTDSRYDDEYVEDILCRFLDRKYAKDGHGGLFVIDNCNQDLRLIEIWSQMNWYLDSLEVIA